jgi:trans-2-enoyl-CoA reductase
MLSCTVDMRCCAEYWGAMLLGQVGEGVKKLHKGQRVIPFTAQVWSDTGNGSFQKYVAIGADFVWPVPDYLSDEVAAQCVINPFTSYSLLKDLQVPKGEYMIQSAAGSTLGKQVISLAKHWGIKTINVVRRADQKAELKALGADEVICSSDEDVVARVKEITGGQGAWGGLDAVCGTMTATSAASVRADGVVFLYGVLAGYDATVSAVDLLFRRVDVKGWVLYSKVMDQPEKCQALAPEVAPLVRDGIIPVAEVRKYDLTDFKQALAKAEEPGVTGKIFLVSE